MDNNEIIEKGIKLLIESVKRIEEISLDSDMSSFEKESQLEAKNARFTGIADMLNLLTGKEYHWSTSDKYYYNLIVVEGSGEGKILFTV
jgi:hypothetical protein